MKVLKQHKTVPLTENASKRTNNLLQQMQRKQPVRRQFCAAACPEHSAFDVVLIVLALCQLYLHTLFTAKAVLIYAICLSCGVHTLAILSRCEFRSHEMY